MRAVDVIAKKRDGRELSRGEISFMVRGYTGGDVADYQMSALLMAIFLRGMTNEETFALTEEMLKSGAVVDFSDLGRPRVDKHSTGGVGDKTSLVVAPVVAAAGVLVPMISGRIRAGRSTSSNRYQDSGRTSRSPSSARHSNESGPRSSGRPPR